MNQVYLEMLLSLIIDLKYLIMQHLELLEGITVGGHKLSYHQQILDLQDSWLYVCNSVTTNRFTINKDMCNK